MEKALYRLLNEERAQDFVLRGQKVHMVLLSAAELLELRAKESAEEGGDAFADGVHGCAALAALSGFRYDMTRGMIGFSPQQTGDFSTLWSLEPAWGTYCVCNGRAALSVLGGCLPLRQLALPGRRPVELRLQGQPVSWRMEGEMILLEADIQAGQRLEIL